MLKDRIRIKDWSRPTGNVDVFFSILEDAHSFSRYWVTIENEVINDDRSCKYKVLPNHDKGNYPHTLNYYPPREVVESWMAIFEEDESC